MTLHELLDELLRSEQCPALDRWFSDLARRQNWPVARQKALWEQLRVCLVRAGQLERVASLGAEAGWTGFRNAMKGQLKAWIELGTRPQAPGGDDGWLPGWLRDSWKSRVTQESWSPAVVDQLAREAEKACPWHIRFPMSDAGRQARLDFLGRGVVRRGPTGFDEYHGPGPLISPYLKRGAVQTQDAASQQTLEDLDLTSGLRVWDVCAGQGGKTLLAAERLANKGVLIATDISERKLIRLKQRVKVSGWQNVRTLLWSGDLLPEFPREITRHEGFDRVFVDAPCTASGTWRRDPEARWRLTRGELEDLGRHQRRLLRLGWKALRNGGRLTYITCSWLTEENEQVANEFSLEFGVSPLRSRLLGPPDQDSNWMFVATWEKLR